MATKSSSLSFHHLSLPYTAHPYEHISILWSIAIIMTKSYHGPISRLQPTISASARPKMPHYQKASCPVFHIWPIMLSLILHDIIIHYYKLPKWVSGAACSLANAAHWRNCREWRPGRAPSLISIAANGASSFHYIILILMALWVNVMHHAFIQRAALISETCYWQSTRNGESKI